MKTTRYHKRIIVLGCLMALTVIFFQPFDGAATAEIATFLEPRIEFVKSARFTIFDHSLDLVLDWLRSNS